MLFILGHYIIKPKGSALGSLVLSLFMIRWDKLCNHRIVQDPSMIQLEGFNQVSLLLGHLSRTLLEVFTQSSLLCLVDLFLVGTR
jgi:hypothetical protein